MGVVLRVLLIGLLLSSCGVRREVYEWEPYEIVRPRRAPVEVPVPVVPERRIVK